MRRNESSRRRAHQGRAKKGKRKKKEKEGGIKKKRRERKGPSVDTLRAPGINNAHNTRNFHEATRKNGSALSAFHKRSRKSREK